MVMDETFEVEIMQFMRPRPAKMNCNLQKAVEHKYREMKRTGARLTAEVLATGQVSLCIEESRLGDFLSEVVPNGPEVPRALERMLAQFNASRFRLWCLAQNEEESGG